MSKGMEDISLPEFPGAHCEPIINRLRHALIPAEPMSKECPYCYSVIPAKAVRCGACTSELQKAAID